LEDLRVSNPDPLPTASTRGGKKSEREKNSDDKPRENQCETKKVQIPVGIQATVEIPVAVKVAKRNDKNLNKEKNGEEEIAPLRVNKRVTVSRREDDALALLKFLSSAEQSLQNQDTDAEAFSTSLGIALVASALGRKVPSARICDDVTGMAECHVELSATYKNLNASASIAPPN